jgi:hypothetical protein
LSEDTIKIVLKAHPGKVVETEFGIEANGDASYEFDIELNRRRFKEVNPEMVEKTNLPPFFRPALDHAFPAVAWPVWRPALSEGSHREGKSPEV